VTADPLVLVPEVARSTTRLLETVRSFDGAGLAAPTLCTGWTRGHIVTHVARNADSLVNLLTWARTGVETPQYRSREARDEDIEAGASRPLDEQLADLTATHEAFLAAVDEMPPSAWGASVRHISGTMVPAAKIIWSRLCEVEIHHVDLCAGYGPPDWPPGFAQRLLHELTVPDGVSGSDHALAAWLIGRSDGADLTVSTGGALPPVPPWK
jgi:maleylpyruvate isomerase